MTTSVSSVLHMLGTHVECSAIIVFRCYDFMWREKKKKKIFVTVDLKYKGESESKAI